MKNRKMKLFIERNTEAPKKAKCNRIDVGGLGVANFMIHFSKVKGMTDMNWRVWEKKESTDFKF